MYDDQGVDRQGGDGKIEIHGAPDTGLKRPVGADSGNPRPFFPCGESAAARAATGKSEIGRQRPRQPARGQGIAGDALPPIDRDENGRAWCREREWQEEVFGVVAGTLKKKKQKK